MIPPFVAPPSFATPADALAERARCRLDPARFLEQHTRIDSPAAGGWIPFALWPCQRDALAAMIPARTLAVLKARQLGLTWLALGYALWRMQLHAPAALLLFSRREAEVRDLLQRLRAMAARLPPPLRSRTRRAAGDLWELANGSTARAFSTSGARSYTGTLALVDEADFVPDLAAFLNAVKPTIDGGGQLFLISTPDKAQPHSPFKQIWRAAAAGDLPGGAALFLPWHAHPQRTPAWYAAMRRHYSTQRGSDDDLFQEYPATAEEALRVRALAARIPPAVIAAATRLLPAWEAASLPPECPAALAALPDLRIFTPPQPGRRYAAGVDPAQGNPESDESALTLLDVESGAQVAVLAGRRPLDAFAAACAALCAWYGGAPLLVERNNHGHALLLWLGELGAPLLPGPDGRPGFLTTHAAKTRLWDEAARTLAAGAASIADSESAAQLAALDGLTLRAPHGLHDDRAMAFALALAACAREQPRAASTPLPPEDLLAAWDAGGWR